VKANLKGGNAIVRFLLAHGEKLGMAGIVACAGWLLWSAMGVPRLESGKDAATLTRLAGEAQQHVNSFTYEMIKEQAPEEVPKVKPIPVDPTKQIAREEFPNLPSFNPSIVPPIGPRTDPVLLAAEDLEVNSDSGLWASGEPEIIKQRMLAAATAKQREKAELEREQEREQAEGGGMEGRSGRGRRDDPRGPEGERTRRANTTIVMQPTTGIPLQGFEEVRAQAWVTVLAKVPVKAQYEMYEDSLASAKGYDPTRDLPEYIGYYVERAEVTSQGQGEWVRIAQVNRRNLIKELSTYPVNSPEVVDTPYVHSVLTHPLPPLILKEWDKRVSHSSMPLAAEAARLEAERLENEATQPAEGAEPAEGGEEDFSVREGMGPGGPMMGPGTDMPRGVPGGYGRGEYGGEYGGRGEYGGEYGGRGGYGGGFRGEYGGESGRMGGYGEYGMGAGAGIQLQSFVWDHKTENVLLRFFDNSVEPGHRYRYRVQLALGDVNNRVPEQYLDRSVTDRRAELTDQKKMFRLTEWSKPSPIASVPLPARIYVAKADPAKDNAYNSQPEVEILIKALNSVYAAEIAIKDKFPRGCVMNIKEKATVIWSNQYDEEQDPEFDFRTGATVIDIQGGEKLGRDLTVPARVVLMDAAGKLTVQRELGDEQKVKQFNAIVEQGAEMRDRGGMGRGEMGGEGYDRGGGRGGRGF
jgi:hypothetical protein